METRLGERLAAEAVEKTTPLAAASAEAVPVETPAAAARDKRPPPDGDVRAVAAIEERRVPADILDAGKQGSPIHDADPGDETPVWPDESAESAFLAEARERGEPAKATPAAIEQAEEAAAPKVLPKLEDLVDRIPVEVRDTIEELFRAKFVRVQRVPKKALKT